MSFFRSGHKDTMKNLERRALLLALYFIISILVIVLFPIGNEAQNPGPFSFSVSWGCC